MKRTYLMSTSLMVNEMESIKRVVNAINAAKPGDIVPIAGEDMVAFTRAQSRDQLVEISGVSP